MVVQAVRSDPGRTEQLLARPAALREHSLAERFYQMLALPSHRLEAALRGMIQAEHELPDAARYPAVLERLRAWLDLDPEDARILARAWEQALDTFPDDYAARNVDAERAVILNGLSFREFTMLAEVLPWLRGEQGVELLAGDEAGSMPELVAA